MTRSASNPRTLIVADDLTGGNACGALFAEAGLSALTLAGGALLGSTELAEVLASSLARHDAVVVNAASRHLGAVAAHELTRRIVAAGQDVDLVSCRIDTTLRGPVGAYAAGALAARRSLAPNRRVVGLCIPAFPAAGRTTVDGRQLLDGALLEDTELAHDVRSPMTTSVVADILAGQGPDTGMGPGAGTGLTSHLVDLGTIDQGPGAVRAALLAGLDAGVDVLVSDTVTDEHIALVAEVAAGLTADQPDLEWLGIDPGPGSLALARALRPDTPAEVVLGVSGSATEITRSQLAGFGGIPGVHLMRVVLDETGLPDVEATAEAVRADASARAIVIGTVLDETDLRDLGPEQSAEIPRRLARIARAVMESRPVSGLYVTGGDVTAEVLTELDAIGIELDGEIIPLAVAGRLAGGPHEGTPIVTKGGLIGDADTPALILDHLDSHRTTHTSTTQASTTHAGTHPRRSHS